MSMHFIKHDTKIDFIGLRYYAFALSLLMILVGAVSLGMKGGPRYGIDFAGGVILQTKFDTATDIDTLKKTLEATNLPGLTVQQVGPVKDNDFLVRFSTTEESSDSVQKTVVDALGKDMPGAKYAFKRIEMVGPKVGEDLRGKALEAMYFAILLIAIYISGRFEHRWMAAGLMAAGLFAGITGMQYLNAPQVTLVIGALVITLGLCWFLKLNYALGAIAALIHDVLVTVGIFSILNKEFDLTIIAALLTLIGFSLNDTIIVYDRIREIRGYKTGESLTEIINKSVNQTLSRTIMTKVVTMIVVVALLFLGGPVLRGFSEALAIGILAGTYSSIYISSAIALDAGLTAEHVFPTVKKSAVDDMP